MTSRRDRFNKLKLPKLRQLFENQELVNQVVFAPIAQVGGKVLTRAEEKKLNLTGQLTNKNEEEQNVHDNPVASTSTGTFTGPPMLQAYKKTAKKIL